FDYSAVPALLLRNIEGKVFAIPILEQDLTNLKTLFDPDTNELTSPKVVARVIEALDGRLEAILIAEVRDREYIVKMILRKRISRMDKEVEIRAADAIARSVLTGAPIYVSEKVLREVGVDYSE
ncbi:MAG: bifunctional nuclease domain-containing protein, partial [Nitrososphaerales archaeon]